MGPGAAALDDDDDDDEEEDADAVAELAEDVVETRNEKGNTKGDVMGFPQHQSVVWRGVAYQSVVWRGVAYQSVVWRGVAYQSVVWRGVAYQSLRLSPSTHSNDFSNPLTTVVAPP
jgi:hypothetical protein